MQLMHMLVSHAMQTQWLDMSSCRVLSLFSLQLDLLDQTACTYSKLAIVEITLHSVNWFQIMAGQSIAS